MKKYKDIRKQFSKLFKKMTRRMDDRSEIMDTTEADTYNKGTL